MKLGVFTVLLSAEPLKEALTYLKNLGVGAVEIGSGGYPGTDHADPDVLLNDEAALAEFRETVEESGLLISALSCHGNPVHPDPEKADAFRADFEKTILLAEKLGIRQINTFSGCPGDPSGSKYPNWVTCAWPPEYAEIMKWQWEEVLIPYWKKAAAFAKSHGVDKIALEPHPGFCVYNTETLLRLRAAVGPEIGANLDPSHLIWQGMDPVAVIRELKDAVFHFHAKDTRVDPYNTARNGVLDTKNFADEQNRSWLFRSVGYGSDLLCWKNIVSELRLAGYDHVISIEHEDSLMTPKEGLGKAVEFLKQVIPFEEKNQNLFWA